MEKLKDSAPVIVIEIAVAAIAELVALLLLPLLLLPVLTRETNRSEWPSANQVLKELKLQELSLH